VSSVLIELHGEPHGTRAAVESGFFALQTTAAAPAQCTLLCGRYLDRFERRGDTWKIAHRRGLHDFSRTFDPADTSLEASTAFMDETLRLAQDPSAWPILVHCHGNMDRTPAWMGIYRFLVEGRPLLEIMREIEQHRGSRPKSSVTILYNRVLAERAPERYAADPTAAVLRESAKGVVDPAWARAANPRPMATPNPVTATSVSSELEASNHENPVPSRRR